MNDETSAILKVIMLQLLFDNSYFLYLWNYN